MVSLELVEASGPLKLITSHNLHFTKYKKKDYSNNKLTDSTRNKQGIYKESDQSSVPQARTSLENL